MTADDILHEKNLFSLDESNGRTFFQAERGRLCGTGAAVGRLRG